MLRAMILPSYRLLSRRMSSSLSSSSSSSALSAENSLRASQDAVAENLRMRRQLALSYRLLDRLDLNEGACNHLSAMAPARLAGAAGQQPDVMLLAPGYLDDGSSLHWSEVTASSLIGLGAGGDVVEAGCWGGSRPEESAACIHLGVRRARPDAKVVFHVHARHSTALSCLKDPTVLPVHQNSLRFISRAAYYGEYDVPDAIEEGVRIGEGMGQKDVLFMRNHGTLVVAPTVHLAFDDTYYLERACMTQLMALAAVRGDLARLAMLDDKAVEAATKTFNSQEYLDKYSIKHFFSWWNKFLREEPDVFS